MDRVEVEARAKYIEENFTEVINALPDEDRDVEFIPRWECLEIVKGRYTEDGFMTPDIAGELVKYGCTFLDISRWRYV